MTLEEILSDYTNNEKASSGFYSYSLEGIKRILEILGNPHLKIRTVHIAGTNGKGSVCHMLHDILTAHGLRTGLYISPHLESVNERIIINGNQISGDDLFSVVSRIDVIAKKEKITLTWFDMLTTSMFLYFFESKVDIAVIETGLGGTLDSTNVANPELSIITGVSFDHMHMLGPTIEEIALNKAGIIKEGKSVITAAVSPALDIIRERAKEAHADFFIFGKDFKAENILEIEGGIKYNYSSSAQRNLAIEIPHPGTFQSVNASIVLKAAEILSERGIFSLNSETAAKALGQTHIPGRMQILNRTPLILFDPAHNAEALASLADTVNRRYGSQPIKIFICLMKDKRPEEMLDYIGKNIPGTIIYCRIDDPRAFTPVSDLKTLDAEDIPSIRGELSEKGLNLFTGSFRLYHAARQTADFYPSKGIL
jgi:dihydrofolate synthase / folylpolyglutamate synthase